MRQTCIWGVHHEGSGDSVDYTRDDEQALGYIAVGEQLRCTRLDNVGGYMPATWISQGSGEGKHRALLKLGCRRCI